MNTTITAPRLPSKKPKPMRLWWPGLAARSPKIPAEILARHVLETVPAQEWPVRVEAMDALLRRLESGRKDELRIESRPEGDKLLGLYATRRRGSEARPLSHDGLGRRSDQGAMRLSRLPEKLAWPVQTYPGRSGPHPWPARVAEAGDQGASTAGGDHRRRAGLGSGSSFARPGRMARAGDLDRRRREEDGQGTKTGQALAWFRPARNGAWSLKKTYRDDPARRLELVESLLKVVPARSSSLRHDPALRACSPMSATSSSGSSRRRSGRPSRRPSSRD